MKKIYLKLMALALLSVLSVTNAWAVDLYVRGYNGNWNAESATKMEGTSSPWTFTAKYWSNASGFKIADSSYGSINCGSATISAFGTKYNMTNSGSSSNMSFSIPTGGGVYTITVTLESGTYKIKVDKLAEEGNSWVDINAPKVYWDNTNANYTNVSMLNGRVWAGYDQALGSMASALTHITNTNLWYNTSINNEGNAGKYTTTLFLNANWSTWETSVATSRAPYATSFTASNTASLNSNTYLFSAANGNRGATLSRSQLSSGYSELNKTQTIEVYVKMAGGSYTKNTSSWPGTLTPDRYYLSDATTATHVNNTALTASSSVTVSAVLTSAFSLSESSTATGYNFDGWGTSSSSTPAGKSAPYSIAAISGTNTICAFFSEKTFSVAFADDGHGSVTEPASTPKTVGQLTGIDIDASDGTGYHFDTWEITSGTGSFGSDASTADNTFYPTSAATITATFAPNTHSVTLHDNNGGENNGSATSTYDADELDISSIPEKSGYEVEGYYLSDGTTKVANADGSLVDGDVEDYVEDGKWIYDDDATLYAKWSVVAQTYTLSFAVGSSPYNNGTVSATVGGSAASSGTAYNENSSIVITASPSSHYRVKGWYKEAACTNAIAGTSTGSSYSFTLTKDTAVYVGFEQSTATITLDKNTGDDGAATVSATHGSTLPSFTAHTKAGYTLNGYYTETSGGTKIINANGSLVASTDYANGSSQWNSDVRTLTLHAQWTEVMQTISMDVHYDAGSSDYEAEASGQAGVTTEATLTASTPTAAHYTFTGWTLTNLTVTDGDEDKDLEITVKVTDPAGETPAAVANYNEVLTQNTWVLKGGTNITGDDWVTEHAMSKKSGESTSDVVYYTCNITKTHAYNSSDDSYSFKIVKKGASDTWYGLGSGSGEWAYLSTYGEETMTTSSMNIQIVANAVGEYVIKLDYSTPASPKVTVEFPSQFIKGDWDSWTEHAFDKDGYYRVNLDASTTYEFCVNYKSTIYKKNKTITGTNYDEVFNTSDNNCKLTTGAAGYYVFGWNGSTKQLSVLFPADTTKSKFIKDEYIYFDTHNLTDDGSGWNSATFSTRFWIKNFASGVDYGSVNCNVADTVENGIFYVKIPAENLGQMQIERMKPDYTEKWCTADKIYAFDRGTNTTYNMLKEETGKEDYCNTWKPQWSTTTYCPPMKTAVLADNGTSNHGGNGSKETPYLIEKGATIKVTAASSTAFNDDAHMTHKYHFYDGATSKSDQEGATYQFDASSTVNTVHKVVVMPYNTYNSQSSRKTLKSDTLYYKVVQHYTVTYNGSSNTGGEVPTDATHYITGDEVTVLGNSGSLTKEGYTFDGWKDASEESHAAESTIEVESSNITLYAKWADDHNYYFSGATDDDWNTATNWTKGAVPNDIANTIYILQPVEIPAETTIKAAAVNIVTGGTYTRPDAQGTVSAAGHLSIEGGAGLIIAGALKRVADATALATKTNTREEDLHIGSTKADGNGVLIMGTHDGNNQAIVEFYTKSHGTKGSSASVNQFIGTPFSDCNDITYNYHNSWVYKVSYAGGIHWERVNGGEGLNEFKGYNIISADGEDHVYWMGGTLVASTNQSLSLEHNSSSTTENLLANSWMGPIVIGAFQAGDFTNCTQTIYIFNAGSPDDVATQAESDNDDIEHAANGNSGAGQYTSIPINLSPFISGYKTIPSMQSFSIMASETSSAASLALNYNKLVYTPANTNGITYEKNHAPKRVEEEEEKPDFMKLIAVGESGYRDMVWMAVREDFTDGFEDGWEARKMYGEGTAPQMYAMSEAGEMAIDAVAELEGTVLAFHKGTEDNAYTFSFKYDGDGVWYLNDLQEQKSTRISEENNYAFTSAKGDNAARFVISKTPMSPTGIEGVGDGSVIRKLMIDGTLYIIRAGRMYNVEGALVK